MAKILYITYDGLTDPLGQSQILPYIIGTCQKDDSFEFHIISFEKKQRFQQNKNIINNLIEPYKIHWQPLSYTKKPPVLATMWDIVKLNQKFKKLLKTQKFSIIHCRSYIGPLVVLPYKKHRNNFKFIFDMRGFWPDERIDGNIWNLKNPIYKLIYNFFKRKEREFIYYSDKIIALTECGKNEILKWNIANLTPEKIQVIPCTADYNIFTLTNIQLRNKAKEKLGLSSNTFILGYLGSLGTWYLTDEMLLFYNLLKKKFPNSKFLFITPNKKEEIISIAKKYDLQESDFLVKFLNRKDIPDYAHAIDYGIFFIKQSYSKKMSSPTKMGEFLAMGIPIICNNNVGDVEDIMNKLNAGFCINKLTPASYKNVINNLSFINNNNIHYNIHAKSKNIFELKNAINSYISTYYDLLK